MTTISVGYLVGSLARASIDRKLAAARTRLAPPALAMRELTMRALPIAEPPR